MAFSICNCKNNIEEVRDSNSQSCLKPHSNGHYLYILPYIKYILNYPELFIEVGVSKPTDEILEKSNRAFRNCFINMKMGARIAGKVFHNAR
jgi:hypothetical protein